MLLLLALGVWGTWRWWTAPPATAAATMAAAVALAPDDADGIIVLAEPGRAARWLVGHPQALGLLPVAAPAAYRTVAALQPVVRALAVAAQGPLVIWWKGDAAGLGAATDARAANGLRRIAELRGLAFSGDDASVRIASAATLLGQDRRAQPPLLAALRLAVLALVRGRWWEGEASRIALILRQGTAPALSAPTPTSQAKASDASTLAAPAGLPVEPFHGPACLAFAAGRGWGLSLPTASWPSALRTALGGRWPQAAPGAVPGAERWTGLAGELFVLPRLGVTAASDAPMLASVGGCNGRSDEGCLDGKDLAWAADRVATLADRLAPLASRSRRLREAAPLLARLARVRWRFGAGGAVVLFEW